MTRIKTAKPTDMPQIMEMAREIHKESEYGVLEFSQPKAYGSAMALISGNDSKLIVAESGSILVGMMAMECMAPHLSDDVVAGEQLIYVRPEHRGTAAFFLMIDYFVSWADEKNAKLLYLRNSSGINVKRTELLYSRLGFDRVGGIYRRKL